MCHGGSQFRRGASSRRCNVCADQMKREVVESAYGAAVVAVAAVEAVEAVGAAEAASSA